MGSNTRDDCVAPLVLAIDVGSSSVKAALYDARAQVFDAIEVKCQHPLHASTDGAVQELPEHVIGNVEQAINGVLQRAGERQTAIAAVAMDTMASTVLGVDRDGRPLTPVYTYADTRSQKEVDALRAELDLQAVYQRTGCPQHNAYLPGRLRWLQRTSPDVVRRVARWMDAGTFLYSRWFERRDVPVSHSVASWTGLLDRHHLVWDEDLLRHLPVPVEALPPLADYADAMRGLSPAFSQRWPALRDVPFFLAVGDGAAANVGSGCIGPDRLALTVGTSGALRLLIPGRPPEVPPGLWAYLLSRNQNLLGGSFSEGGNVYAWATETLRLPPMNDDVERALQASPPDGHGLTVLPFLAGERSPGWSTSATSAVVGLRAGTTPLHILQAFLEATAYRFGLVATLLQGHARPDYRIIASGGAITKSPYWLQVMADVLQRPVTVCAEEDATVRGAAVLALHALGRWRALDDVPAALGATYEPNPRRGNVYQTAMKRQHRLYDALLGHETEITQRLAKRGPVA